MNPIAARLLLVCPLLMSLAAGAEPVKIVDLSTIAPSDGVVTWVYGNQPEKGVKGVPVAGGFRVDTDQHKDYAVAYLQADLPGKSGAGEVALVFGDGTIGGFVDTAVPSNKFLRIHGATTNENTGSEIWMDDVTGDGLGDLLICRQNFDATGRINAGALTIVVGGEWLRTLANSETILDLATPPASAQLITIIGADAGDRLCIWTRTGNVDGDSAGIADIVVAADQEDAHGVDDAGAVYVIRGGAHLVPGLTIDLADFGTTAIEGHLARFTPPAPTMSTAPTNYHTGATCQIADLDGNGRAEVLAAAALNRSGAGLGGEATGGSTDGTLYIAWDDNFPITNWEDGYSFDIATSPGGRTIIAGETINRNFGEEILGGNDYDNDGNADLFIGDINGDGTVAQNRSASGIGYVFYHAALLRNLVFDLENPPESVMFSKIVGPNRNAIAGDTVADGDFDGDGIADLAFASPHGNPDGRLSAGEIHVLLGQNGPWPAFIDTANGNLPDPSALRVVEIQGARGTDGSDKGDTLSYSAAAADINGDGFVDLITNEMVGNGISPNTVDAGNLIIISGALIAVDDGGSRGIATVPIPLPAALILLIAVVGFGAYQMRVRNRR